MQPIAHNTVLLVVDVQKGFDEPVWGYRNNPDMEQRIAELLAEWRKTGRPVIHAKHMSNNPHSPLRPGNPGNDFKPAVAPEAGEIVIETRVNNCFIGTSLEDDLRRRGLDSIVIVGLTTSHCISTTARMAGNLGFNTCVVSDATATFDRVGVGGIYYTAQDLHGAALCDLHGEFATVVYTQSIIKALRATQAIISECAT